MDDDVITLRVGRGLLRRAQTLIKQGVQDKDPAMAAQTALGHSDVLRYALALGLTQLEVLVAQPATEVSDAG